MVIRADGYKIFPGLGVVVLFQSNGFAVMLVYCVHLAHCGKEIEIPCGTYGWFGIFVTINISYSRSEGKNSFNQMPPPPAPSSNEEERIT